MKLNGTGATTTAKNEVFIGKDMKTVVLWRGGGGVQKFGEGIFLGGGRPSKARADDGILVK